MFCRLTAWLFGPEVTGMIYASSCTISARTAAVQLTLPDLRKIGLDAKLPAASSQSFAYRAEDSCKPEGKMRRVLFLVMGFLIAATFVHAGTITGTTTRSGNDSADWGQLGPDFTAIPISFAATSTGGVGIAGSLVSPGEVLVQSTSWDGNFAPGANLLWTKGGGPLTLSFSRAVSGAGAQIQTDDFGDFTAEICSNVGCFSENGVSNSNADNSAIYIGLLDTTPGITFITFQVTSCSESCNDFAINQLSVTDGVTTTTPEPSSLLLFGTSLLGLAPFRRKLFGR
jgi:hypothetical protein